MGAKKRPFYRVVVADSRSPRDGRFIDEIGYYDPTKEPAVIKIDVDKAIRWINNGAQPTDTARSLLRKSGVFKQIHDLKQAAKAPAAAEAHE